MSWQQGHRGLHACKNCCQAAHMFSHCHYMMVPVGYAGNSSSDHQTSLLGSLRGSLASHPSSCCCNKEAHQVCMAAVTLEQCMRMRGLCSQQLSSNDAVARCNPHLSQRWNWTDDRLLLCQCGSGLLCHFRLTAVLRCCASHSMVMQQLLPHRLVVGPGLRAAPWTQPTQVAERQIC